MVRMICASLSMRIEALGTNVADAPSEGPVLNPINKPPPNAALALRNSRRDVMSSPLLAVRRVLDSLADSHVSTAATDVPRHRGADLAVGRAAGGGEQCRCGH